MTQALLTPQPDPIRFRGVVCAVCYAPIPDRSPSPSDTPVNNAAGQRIGVTSYQPQLRCPQCQPRTGAGIR